MTARKTRCLTWGEYRRASAAIVQNGQRVGAIHFDAFVTICGRLDDSDPSDPCGLDASKRRPIGVCRACWDGYRAAQENL